MSPSMYLLVYYLIHDLQVKLVSRRCVLMLCCLFIHGLFVIYCVGTHIVNYQFIYFEDTVTFITFLVSTMATLKMCF